MRMNRLVRRFLLTILAIAGTLAVGTAGFTVIDHYPPFDAFYMTLITMTTVGYGEIHPLSQAGRVFNSFLILFGVTTIFIAIGAMTQFYLNARRIVSRAGARPRNRYQH